MATFHGCHTSFNYRNSHHQPNRAPMACFHGYHSSQNHHNSQHPSNHLELSSDGVDRLEAALAKLTFSQFNPATTVDTLATSIDNLLQRLSPHNPTPYFSSTVPVQASTSIILTPLMSTLRLMPTSPPMPPPPPMPTPSPMPTLSPMPTPLPMPPPSSMPPPLPMPIVPLCPAPVQPFLPPLSGSLPMVVLHLPNLGLVRTTIFFNIVPLYGAAMATYKLQSFAFALSQLLNRVQFVGIDLGIATSLLEAMR
ncbi:hypothetical protein GmHk_06G017480 [Glycine max]|nr:hypothetical protein GmHk_06G017480 [Glycine max]